MRHFPAFDDIRSITVPSATNWKLRCWPNAALLLVTKTWEKNCKVSRPPLFKIIYISIFKSFHGGWRFPVDHGIPIILAVHGLWLWYPQLISPGFSTRLIRFKSKGSLRKLYSKHLKTSQNYVGSTKTRNLHLHWISLALDWSLHELRF